MNIDLSGLPDPGDQPTDRLPDTHASTLRTAYRQSQPEPEQYGKIRDISNKTGIPRPVVSRNIPTIERAAQEPDWSQLESTAPVLTKEMAANLDLFNLAKDDTENLSWWETEVRAMTDLFFDVHAGWKSGAMTDELGILGYQMKQGHDTPEIRARIQELNNRLEVWKGTGGFAENASKILGQMFQGIPEIATFAAGTGLTAGGSLALAGQTPPLIALPEELVTVPAATAAGFASGWFVKAGERAHRIEAGHAYLDMIEQDIDPEIASAVATGVGLFNAALEMGGMAAVATPVKRALGKLFSEKATQVLVQQTSGQAAKRFLRDYTAAWAAETGTEVVQEVVNVLGEEIAKYLDPKDLESLISTESGREQIMDRLGTILEDVGKGMAVLALPGATMNFRADMERAYRAEENQQRILAMGDNAQASKLRERSPELFQEYVDKIADGGPVENIYVNADQFRTFFQIKGLDPAAVVAEIPSVQAQYEEALNTGGDLVIPLGEYAAKVATTEYHQELSDIIRLRAEDMSAAEAKEWQKTSSEEFSKEADRVLAEQEDSESVQQSADTVFEQIRSDIVATGKFTDDAATAYATLHKNFSITMADRLGMQPHEIYQRYGLRTRVPSPAAEPRPSPGEAPAGGTLLEQEKRGSVAFMEDITKGPSIITLYDKANLSTFLHESGHFFFEVMTDIAGQTDSPQLMKQDVQKLMTWYGIKDLKKWQKMSDNKRRKYHEQFARGFEAYLFEGKSPNLEMRDIFSLFRTWLINIYRSIKNLDVELTDEVRGVMDRMIATDDQIRLAQAAQGYRPLFESAEQAGMTQAEWTDYLRGDLKAQKDAQDQLSERSLREMKWLANAKSRIIKDLQADAKEKRAAVKNEVTAEVEREPVYRAMRWLRKGEMVTNDGEQIKAQEGFKLDRTAVEDLYPPDALVDFDWKTPLRGMTAARETVDGEKISKGLHPDLVAEMFGFSSGDHLIRSIAEADRIGDVIERRTDEVMLERYGDVTDPVAMERAAEEAIHNNARAKFISAEYAALAKKTGKRKILTEAARDYAAEKIARQKVKDAIRSGRYSVAERKAGQQAERAFGKGDSDTAAIHKRAQLLNIYMYRESVSARKEVDKIIGYFRKFEKNTVRKAVGIDYMDQIDQLMEAFDFRRRTAREIRRRESLSQWIEKQSAMGLEPAIDENLTGDLGKRHYRDITVEELRGVYDAVRNIEHLGRLKNKLLMVRRKKDLDATLDEVSKTIRKYKAPLQVDIETRLPKQEASRAVSSFFASHRKFASLIRQMDGFKDGGPLWEIFVKPLNEVTDREVVMREDATKRLTKLFSVFSTSEFRWMYEKYHIPSIGKSLTKQARIAIALNWGNLQNRQRITDSLKMSGYISDESQMQAILDTLGKRDWDFVQSVWDYLEEFWPQIEAKERRVTGLVPEKVSAAKVNTRFGEYRGGYYPIHYDERLSPRSYADKAAEVANQSLRGKYARDTTRRGHTQARVDEVKRPVRLDYGVIFEHVEQVIHDLSFHEYLVDTNRLMGSQKFQSAVLETYGHEIYQQLKNTISDVAAGEVPAQTQFQRSINWLRSGASIAAMGWNVGTALLQPFGLTQSMVRIGPKWVAKGLSRWFRDAASLENTVRWIHDNSKFMASRAKTMQREINEVRNRVVEQGLRRRILGPFEDSYFWLISRSQMIADVPTWLGAYEKAMAGGETERRAYSLADQAVIDSQGGGQVKDLAQIQRGGPLMKLWTNFYSYFNVTLNLTAESFAKTDFRRPESVGRLGVDLLMLYMMPATLSWILREALIKGECEGGSDLECVGEKLIRENLGYMAGTMVGLREISGTIQGYYGYEGPAGARAFSEIGNFMAQAQQGELDTAFWKALNNTAGIMLHYPAGQVQRTAEGILAMSEGETSNPFSLLIGPSKE